jgi:hypothetical protein
MSMTNTPENWLYSQRMDGKGHHKTFHWFKVLWLTAADYFSTIGYQPGIALAAVGVVAPFATLMLVIVTIFGALPVYREVASRSYRGQGSISMMQHILPGWKKPIAILVLIGFAMTDFSITKTLSAADAAKHLVENPLYQEAVFHFFHTHLHGTSDAVQLAYHHQMGWTIAMLAALAGVFLLGFREAIGVGLIVGIPYTVLNLFLGIYCLGVIWKEPHLFFNWKAALNSNNLTMLGLTGVILRKSFKGFPELALGLSGFETGTSVMPQISCGKEEDHAGQKPINRIRNTHHLLLTAAVVMGVLLMVTSLASVVLVPEEAYRAATQTHPAGEANGRVMSWLAHKYLGHAFGTTYDLSTIAILWFAGASAMAGILNQPFGFWSKDQRHCSDYQVCFLVSVSR